MPLIMKTLLSSFIMETITLLMTVADLVRIRTL